MDYLPRRAQDNTDRNRTSPVAFTGNKFEVRCVGSSQPPATSNLVLNAITADSFYYLAEEISKEKKAGKSVDDAILAVLQRTCKHHIRIVNDGDGYSPEWPVEAAKRGLLNLKSTPLVLETVLNERNKKLFSSLGIWSEEEFEANITVDSERYTSQIHLEAQSLRNLVDRFILPAGIEYYQKIKSVSDAIPKSRIDKVKSLLNDLTISSEKLADKAKQLQSMDISSIDTGKFAGLEVFTQMAEVRRHADELETLVEYKLWPLPSYEDMLHERHDKNLGVPEE